MEFTNISFTGTNILLLAILQLIFVVALGWIFGTIIKFIHIFKRSSNKVFKSVEYTPQSNGYPQRYRFVIVKYSPNGGLKSETFYTLLGDWTHIEYDEGNSSIVETVFFSNLLLMAFPVIGFLSVVSENLYGSPIYDGHLANDPILTRNGILLFLPTFISGIIKLIFDFAYIKLYD